MSHGRRASVNGKMRIHSLVGPNSVALLTAIGGGTIAFVLTFYVEWHFYGLPDAVWGAPDASSSFGLHPVLAAAGFLLFAPAAAATFASSDCLSCSRLNRSQLKTVHAALHFVALLLGILGVRSIWLTHEESIYKFHFQTLHSWLGIVFLALYALQFTTGLVFFTQSARFDRAKAALLLVHGSAGKYLVMFALITCALGSLATVWKSEDAQPHPFASSFQDWALQNAAGMFMFVELAGLMLVFDRATKARENVASTAVLGARSRRYTEQQNAGEEDFLRPLAITEHD